MKPLIHLALTDDWELRGDGSGDAESLQFRPMRELAGIYERHGVRGTFNAEVMQQLTFRRMQGEHPGLGELADRWDAHVSETFRRGHDIQLHVHSQWRGARYDGGRWRLPGAWSILEYDRGDAREMLAESKEYLENLLRRADPTYRCVSFRAGSLSVAPSPYMLGLLADLGIRLDISIVGGLRVQTRNVRLDYTDCDESFLPFYPRLDDARRVSDKPEPVVCVPIFHFLGPRRLALARTLAAGARKAGRRFAPAAAAREREEEAYAQHEWAEVGSSALARVYEKAVSPCLRRKHLIADLGRLGRPYLREMLREIRRRAAATGFEEVPVVLTNHTKYVTDFAPIEEFVREAARADDIKFITVTELAGKIRAGAFPVRKAAGDGDRSPRRESGALLL